MAGWLMSSLAALLLFATATVLLPYIAHHPVLNQLLYPPPFSAPPPHRLCCAMAGCPRATYAPCCCRWACLLAAVPASVRFGDLADHALYSLGFYFPKTRSAATGDGMMMMMDGNGWWWRGGPGGGRVRKPISMILHALRLRAAVSGRSYYSTV